MKGRVSTAAELEDFNLVDCLWQHSWLHRLVTCAPHRYFSALAARHGPKFTSVEYLADASSRCHFADRYVRQRHLHRPWSSRVQHDTHMQRRENVPAVVFLRGLFVGSIAISCDAATEGNALIVGWKCLMVLLFIKAALLSFLQ